ncbi:MAG: agmatine deiminase family protein, partial [Muribaculaceae bacterium]|nr:agmatine deiminase family protein [Muribaculaceae bacterium]
NDFWMRDYMPVQLTEDTFWYFTFNPDYMQCKSKLPRITNYKDIPKLNKIVPNDFFDVNSQKSATIVDGSNVVKCDDFIIMTDKVFIENRNIHPMIYKETDKYEPISWAKLKYEIGVDIVVIPREPKDRYGHADGLVRYAGSNRILLRAAQSEEDKLFLNTVKETILRQKPGLEIIQFEFDYISDNLKDIRAYNNCYINYLRVGNVIVVPMLSHYEIDRKWEEVYVFTPDDQKALDQLHKWFPECEIFGLTMYDMVSIFPHGWGLNSLTWTIKSHK